MAHIQSMLPLLALLMILLSMELVKAQRHSICQTMQYRALSPMLQNEHQCMILERIQKDFDEERQIGRDHYETLSKLLTSLKASLHKSLQTMAPTSRDSSLNIPALKGIPLVRDCYELQRNGITISGVYPLQLPSRKIVNVWCDMEKGNGGWTVVQKRTDGSVNFTRSWDDYAFGFGNPNSEYWLGNENMYWMTNYANYSLRIDLWDWEDNHAYVMYEYFRLNSEKEFYSLKIEGYSGTAGDAMSSYHDNMKFSTIDSDNDEWYLSCAQKDQSGWWFRSCGFASLNGLYVDNGTVDMAPDGLIRGIIWYNWKKIYGYSMKRTEMKIKPMVAVRIDKEMEKIKTAGLNEGKDIETTTKDPSEELCSFGEKRKEMEEEEWAKRTLKRISRAMTLEERKALDKILDSLKSKTSTHSLSTSTVSSVGTDPANDDSTTEATMDESG